jgi:hypothetical protein
MINKLVCFASGRPGEWEAICLDYDIAVQGRSFDDVQRLLRLSIDDYIESARQETPEVRDRLLNRRVPARVWLGYILGFVWHNLGRRRNRDDGDRLEHSFQMSCPA